MMEKRILVGLAVLAASTIGIAAERPSKPNVILMLADDLGWQDLKCYDIDEPSPYESPNLDALAKRGVLFRNAYSPAPTCSPSRCSIISGKHPARLQKTHVLGGQPPVANRRDKDPVITPWYSGRLGVKELTIAELLRDNGYRTGHSGKWHIAINHNAYPQPLDHGFEVTFAGRGVNSKMNPHRLTGFATEVENDPYRLDEDGIPRDEVTENAIRFIEDSKEDPFFLYYATWLVHYPIQTRSKALLEKYCDKLGVDYPTDPGGWALEGQRNPYYCAMVEMLDAYVGRIVEYLETTDDPRWPGHKLIENTYIVFSSDNGGAEGGGKEIYTDNAPLDKGKSSAKEGGTRVPLIIFGPTVKQGVDSAVLANGLDFYPTIVGWTGVQPPETLKLDGSDLSMLLERNPEDPNLVRDAAGELRNTIIHHFPHGNTPQSTLRRDGFKLIVNYNTIDHPALELYQLEGASGKRVDYEEAKNLATTMPERAEAMKRELEQALEEMQASRPYWNHQVKGGLPGSGKICSVANSTREGESVSLSFEERGAKVETAYLMYTCNGGDQYEEWFRSEAKVLPNQQRVMATLPEGTTHYVFNLIDENNFLVSFPDLGDMGMARQAKKPFSALAIPAR